jgi:Ni/Fe-hydrogenase b-type cytochrome subunit
MKTALTMLIGLVLLAGNCGANDFHPVFPLLDAESQHVIESGNALSTMTTCGQCHDTGFIANSSDHADAGANQLGLGKEQQHPWENGPGYFGQWNPLSYDDLRSEQGAVDTSRWLRRFGGRHVGGGAVAGQVEMGCLLCHSDITNPAFRVKALQDGDFEWANSAPLQERDILRKTAQGWQWNPAMFLADGSLSREVLDIRKPRDENCAQCHGLSDSSLAPPLTIPSDLSKRVMTDRTGEIISPQKLSASGLNLAGKESLDHAFDIHSERVVACVNCHYSLNNPVYFERRQESQPAHLKFDPRRLTSADYLERPLHQFAKGNSTLGLASIDSENSMRRCESCHDASNVHAWLPYKERHFNSLACESCHIPRVYGPALQMLDWTLVDRSGQPQVKYREIEGDPVASDTLIRGFRPVMLARDNVGGTRKLAPFNLVSSWYWLTGDPARPVSRNELVAALYQGESFHPDLLAVLDLNQDGELTGDEMHLDTAARAQVVRERLQANGLTDIELDFEITPFPINHNVVNGDWATKDCSSCHDADSVMAAPFPLSPYQPGGLLVEDTTYSEVDLNGKVILQPDGGTEFLANHRRNGYYIIGLDQVSWIDLAGLLMFAGVTLGVTIHAIGRFIANRRRPQKQLLQHRVYMYDAYDRLWHWLQATVILLLIATGLIIHKPHIFGIFNFAYVVQVHNVLGFILLINAALALFYTVASGTIQRFLPEPRDFFGRAIAQAMYYSRGIFAGEPHPLEKTRENRLNPLQQMTYLAILNILLPAQVITGVLIWGMQKWPQLAAALGGLQVLAPIHTLVAWAFAAFIVMHVYLTTAAGETPGAGIKSMISGWEEVEEHAKETVNV